MTKSTEELIVELNSIFKKVKKEGTNDLIDFINYDLLLNNVDISQKNKKGESILETMLNSISEYKIDINILVVTIGKENFRDAILKDGSDNNVLYKIMNSYYQKEDDKVIFKKILGLLDFTDEKVLNSPGGKLLTSEDFLISKSKEKEVLLSYKCMLLNHLDRFNNQKELVNKVSLRMIMNNIFINSRDEYYSGDKDYRGVMSRVYDNMLNNSNYFNKELIEELAFSLGSNLNKVNSNYLHNISLYYVTTNNKIVNEDAEEKDKINKLDKFFYLDFLEKLNVLKVNELNQFENSSSKIIVSDSNNKNYIHNEIINTVKLNIEHAENKTIKFFNKTKYENTDEITKYFIKELTSNLEYTNKIIDKYQVKEIELNKWNEESVFDIKDIIKKSLLKVVSNVVDIKDYGYRRFNMEDEENIEPGLKKSKDKRNSFIKKEMEMHLSYFASEYIHFNKEIVPIEYENIHKAIKENLISERLAFSILNNAKIIEFTGINNWSDIDKSIGEHIKAYKDSVRTKYGTVVNMEEINSFIEKQNPVLLNIKYIDREKEYEEYSDRTNRIMKNLTDCKNVSAGLKETNKKHNYSNVFNAVSHIFSLHRDDYKSKYLNDILNYFDNLKNIKKGTLSVNNSLGENENENSFQILGNRLGQSLINNKIPLEDYEKLISHPIFEYGIKNDFIKVVKEDKIKKIKL